MPWLSSDLLSDVRRSGMLPDSAPSGVSDADILAHANKELQSRMLPLVNSVREEFYVQSQVVPLVANQQFYRIPGRSIGNRLRDVQLQLSDGSLQNLTRIAPEAVPEMSSVTPAVTPFGYYLESDSVMVVPTPSAASASLVMKYLLRPGWLITHNDSQSPHVTTVTDLGGGLKRIAYTGNHNFGTNRLDIVSLKPPFRTVMIGVVPVAASMGQIDVNASDLPSDFTTANFGGGANVGAVVSLAENTPVIQLPPELQMVLNQRVLCRVLQSIGDLEALSAAEANAAQMERDAVGLIANRTEGEPKKVVGRLLSQPRRRLGYWF